MHRHISEFGSEKILALFVVSPVIVFTNSDYQKSRLGLSPKAN